MAGPPSLRITHDSGPGDAPGGGAIGAGIAGIVAAARDALGSGPKAQPTLEQQIRSDAYDQAQVRSHEDARAREEGNRRQSQMRRHAASSSHMHKYNPETVYREALSSGQGLSTRIASRAAQMMGPDARSITPNRPENIPSCERYVRKIPRSFIWRDSGNNEISSPRRLEELDLGVGGKFKFSGTHGGVNSPNHAGVIEEYYRVMAQVYAVSPQEAAAVVARELGNPGSPDGFARLRFTPEQIRNASGVEMLQALVDVSNDAQRTCRVVDIRGPNELIRYLSDKVFQAQDTIVAIKASRLCDITREADSAAQSKVLGENLLNTSAGPHIAPQGFHRGSDGSLITSSGRSITPPNILLSQGLSKFKSIRQKAREWLDDDGWCDVGRNIPEAMGMAPAAGQNLSWRTWEEVGAQISERTAAPVTNKTGLLRKTGHYYAKCWEKARSEAEPNQCLDVFRERSWKFTKDAAKSLVADKVSGKSKIGKQAAHAMALEAAWDVFSDMMTDPRCGDSEMTRRVDRCVADLYKASQSLPDEEGTDETDS